MLFYNLDSPHFIPDFVKSTAASQTPEADPVSLAALVLYLRNSAKLLDDSIEQIKSIYSPVLAEMLDVDDWSSDPSIMAAIKNVQATLNRKEGNIRAEFIALRSILNAFRDLPLHGTDIFNKDDEQSFDLACVTINAHVEEELRPSPDDLFTYRRELWRFAMDLLEDLTIIELRLLHALWKAKLEVDALASTAV